MLYTEERLWTHCFTVKRAVGRIALHRRKAVDTLFYNEGKRSETLFYNGEKCRSVASLISLENKLFRARGLL